MAARVGTYLKPKHIPLRTCAGCRRKTAKRDLVRIVRTLEGHVEADPTGKKAGRGTYLCREFACWETAVKKDRLDHALKVKLIPADKEALMAYAQLFKGDT